jgi:hypothetical protein
MNAIDAVADRLREGCITARRILQKQVCVDVEDLEAVLQSLTPPASGPYLQEPTPQPLTDYADKTVKPAKAAPTATKKR